MVSGFKFVVSIKGGMNSQKIKIHKIVSTFQSICSTLNVSISEIGLGLAFNLLRNMTYQIFMV